MHIQRILTAFVLLLGLLVFPVCRSYAIEPTGIRVIFFDPRCSTTNPGQFKTSDEFLNYVFSVVRDIYNKNPNVKPITAEIVCGTYTAQPNQQQSFVYDGTNFITLSSPQLIVAPGVSSLPVTTTYTAPGVMTAGTAMINPNVGTATAGQTITVSWNGIAHPTNTDFFALYLGNNLTDTKAWAYTNAGATCTQQTGNAQSGGSCSFTLPTNIPTGSYILRLHSAGNAGTVLAASSSFSITGVSQPTPTPSPIPMLPQAATAPVYVPTVNKAPTVITTQLKEGTVGASYGSQILVMDENPNDSLSVSITTTELPRGLSLVKTSEYIQNNIRYATYELTGIPKNAERFNPEVTVRDQYGATTTRKLQIIVNNPGETSKQTIKASQAAKGKSTKRTTIPKK